MAQTKSNKTLKRFESANGVEKLVGKSYSYYLQLNVASASAVFCLCIQKAGAMYEKSEIFKPVRIQLKRGSCFRSNFSLIYNMLR